MKLKIQFLLITLFFLFIHLSAQTISVNGVPRDTSYTLHQAYQTILTEYPYVQYVEKMPEDITAVENINYKSLTATRFLSLSVYRPDNKKQLPVVMMIHGGSWKSGMPEMQKMLAMHVAAKGFVAVVPEYRLTPEAMYPAAIEDLQAALAWIDANAKKYGIDHTKIAVSGCDAGGQLTTLLGVKNASRSIKAAVNIDGVSTFMDLETIRRARTAQESGNTLPENAQWLGGTRDEAYDNWQQASPLYHINKYSAPTCFIHSGNEQFRIGRDELSEQLSILDIYTEMHTLADAPHDFWLFHPWQQATVNYIANFLNTIFNPLKKLKNSAYDLVVAQDGSGNFRTVQQAIDALPDFGEAKTTVFIRSGIYQEKIVIPDTKKNLSLIGEDAENTVLSFHNFPAKKNRWGNPLGTLGSASVYVCPVHFSAENLTFENASFTPDNTIAVVVSSQDAQFINCRFVGEKRTKQAQ